MRGGKRRSAGRRNGYYWDGLQWPDTAIVTAGTVFELIAPTAQEFMPGTLVRIRGHIAMRNIHATSTATILQKIMYLEVNDAGTITGDHQGIDTHEEDIARRQLWTHLAVIPALDNTGGPNVVIIEVDVKVKVKLEASGKMILALLADVVSASTVNTTGYLRALIQYS